MKRLFPVLGLLWSSIAGNIFADSATWNANPVSGDWNTPANWTPQTVPTEVASFGVSTVTDVSVAADTTIGTISFSAGANPFTIRTIPNDAVNSTLTISGTGITNDSGIAQNLIFETVETNYSGVVVFMGTAMVGALTTITLEGNSSGTFNWGASILFNDQSSAGNGTFYSRGSSVPVSFGGATYFFENSTAGQATLTSDGGSVNGAGGGVIWFWDHSTAGDAVITCNGGTVTGAGGGGIAFELAAAPANATLVANGGTNGGTGGQIVFHNTRSTDADRPRIQVYGNGSCSIQDGKGTLHSGSIEGDGLIALGKNEMVVGGNDLSTNFSGRITGSNTGAPALTKIGAGTLTLSGANRYYGITTVSEGTLIVANTIGTAAVTGLVTVNGGTFGGTGNVSGPVTIGDGTSGKATLAPGLKGPGSLIIAYGLTFTHTGNYRCELGLTLHPEADQVTANTVTIRSGAMFNLRTRGTQTLATGTSFTVISNTSTNPIYGTFSNLPDGGTITAGPNTLQANYEGGDGNDLTLTVVQ